MGIANFEGQGCLGESRGENSDYEYMFIVLFNMACK